ncbi:hypothetical protein FA95DRAFT_1149834 [Auriscalpium vulgare]|uniref:Uncharacterized protein n=1 Tax=Auriscalpium vulgare TaxID=40419 RepID=A0ACB8R4J8_9AGAM|nr:hypothetical protein FA95DRAFT_1149834 [Auriscalpium vulgare]
MHRNDPKVIKGKGMGDKLEPIKEEDAHRKPDLIITSLYPATHATGSKSGHSIGDLDMGELVEKYAYKEPELNFSWKAVLVALELKLATKAFRTEILQYDATTASHTKDLPPWTNVLSTSFRGVRAKAQGPESAKVSGSRGGNGSRDSTLSPPVTEAAPVRKSSRAMKQMQPDVKIASDPSSTPKVAYADVPPSEQEPEQLPPVIQCGVYTLEMMSQRGLGTHRAIVMLMEDEKLWLFVSDREGVLQSHGLDFVEDFPRFVVLLYAFQRLEVQNYGLHETLNPGGLHFHTACPPENSQPDRTEPEPAHETFPLVLKSPHTEADILVRIDPGDFIYNATAIIGRCPQVVGASNANISKMERPKPYAVKIYWPDKNRISEVDIIMAARRFLRTVGLKNLRLDRHLPEILGYQDYTSEAPEDIRQKLGIELPTSSHRILRVIAFNMLQPIRELHGPEFVKAWFDCVKCHYHLWKEGYEHRDPSLSNLMYYKDSEGTVYGVLNDWDLGNIREDPRNNHAFMERTGTIPFMPLALLNSEYWDGKITRTYYHDLESFVWVLAFQCLSFDKGGDRLKEGPRPADAWETGDYEQCYEKKLAFVSGGMEKEDIAQAWKDVWPLAHRLLKVTAGAWANRQTAYEDVFFDSDDDSEEPVQDINNSDQPVKDTTSDKAYYKKVRYFIKYYGYATQ